MTDLKEIRDGRKLNIINYISQREDDKRKRERERDIRHPFLISSQLSLKWKIHTFDKTNKLVFVYFYVRSLTPFPLDQILFEWNTFKWRINKKFMEIPKNVWYSFYHSNKRAHSFNRIYKYHFVFILCAILGRNIQVFISFYFFLILLTFIFIVIIG